MENEYLNPPNPQVTNRVNKRIEELGIYYDEEMVAVVVAAYEDLLKNSFEMKNHLVALMQFGWRQGESDKEYEILDHHSGESESMKGTDIVFMQAVIAKSRFVNPRAVREKEIELEGCDACGILSHCSKDVVSKTNGKLQSICNHCLVYDEQLRDEGDSSMCSGCTKIMCEHHPGETRILA